MHKYLEAGREEGRGFPVICGLFSGCPCCQVLGNLMTFVANWKNGRHMRRRKFAFLSPKKSLLTFPQIAHTPNLSLSGLAWTPAPLPHPDDLLIQKWPGPTAGALSSPPFLPCPCPACTALPAARTGGGTLHPPLQRGGKHQIKTASPSSIGAKGSPSLQNTPQLLHKLHPTYLHTSSCRDVPGGL